MFNLLRNCQTVFQIGCTILHSLQRCMRNPLSPYPCQHLLIYVFLFRALLVDVKLYLIVFLICISLVTHNVEYLFICLLNIYVFSLEKCLFRSSDHF
uniref:Uncharacterized protein n=1 Tax=Equus asinus TaxID=9793 RepID=A0A9L0JJK9_EQUAS